MLINKPVQDFTRRELQELGIKGFVFDSHEAKVGDLFCCLPGLHTDGHRYIDTARQRGVKHFLVHDASYEKPDEIHILVSDTRRSMAILASIFYDVPSRDLTVIGVTGTDGKSTTTYLIQQLLEAMGHPSGMMSTINFKTGEDMLENLLRQSTPEAPQVEESLDKMRSNGLSYAVVEATSHGLSDKTSRLSHIHFRAAVFTNVTIEHLEFHQTIEQYRNDKANLFRQLAIYHPHDGFGVVNGQSPHAKLYIEACGKLPCYLYGVEGQAVWARDIQSQTAGTRFTLCCTDGEKSVFLPLPGSFNVENVLAAVLCVSKLLSCSPLDLISHIEKLKGAPGRMVVLMSQSFTVIVDYAHTPGAFEKILPQVKSTTSGRLIVLFGSGGERNLEKRPMQGELADRYADVIFLTDEDPRLEDSQKILRDIAAGVRNKIEGKNLFLISSRREAMKQALMMVQPGDTVMFLGKGHESCIFIGEEKTPWNEEQVALDLLRELGYTQRD